jgi:hypothetical protein
MPNFWTKTTQTFSEAFNGPRTKDTEFDLKLEDIKMAEKGIASLKTLLNNFLNQTISIRTMCRDMFHSVKMIYDKKSPYTSLASEICEVHAEIEKNYDVFNSSVSLLHSRTSEWSKLFVDVKKQVEKRETLRKAYDHYDEKLEKIYRGKIEKQRKNVTETTKDIEFLNRVK